MSVLTWLNAAAFAVVGSLAIAAFVRNRDRRRAALALAVGGLAFVAVLGRISPLTGYPRALANISLVAFLVSGWGLLLFRHTVLALPRRVLAWSAGILAGVGAIALAARLPTGPSPERSPEQFAVIMLAIVAWSACVAEPAIRFWSAASGRSRIQGRRLRALSLGYLGIILVLFLAMVSQPGKDATAHRLVFQLATIWLAPAMYAALAPPAWLRTRWRSRDEASLRTAVQAVAHAPDHATAAGEALGHAMTLLGGDEGAVVLGDGTLLAIAGMQPDEARWLAATTVEPAIVSLGENGRQAVACPLDTRTGAGVVAVVSGAFTPLFGSDEADLLSDLTVSLSAALERHTLTTALREESARYESLLHTISDLGVGVAITRDGRVAYANEAMESLSGYRRIDLMSMSSFFEIVPEDARHDLAERFLAFLAGDPNASDAWEAPIVRADGDRRMLEGASKLIEVDGRQHVLTIARDVTERTHASEIDRRRGAQLEALAHTSRELAGARELGDLLPAVASAAAGVARADVATVAVTSAGADPSWYDAGGQTTTPIDAIGLADRALEERRVVRATRLAGVLGDSGTMYEALCVPMLRGNAVMGVILVKAARPFDEIDESVLVSLASYAGELIEATRALQRERRMTQRLRELDEIKNSFLAAVSHELRTPLTSVLGFAHTLQRNGDRLRDEERALLVDRLAANAEKLEQLLADLLDLDRLNRGIVEPVLRPTDLSALILRSVEAFDLPGSRTVHVDVSPIELALDGPKIERIVENLLANAVRHTREGTPIWIRTIAGNDGVTISVEDAGTGVPVGLRKAIFEPFQQGDSIPGHAPGVGIGLSLVARFAELHGGRAWVTERDGGGASFRVWLPTASTAVSNAV